MTNNKIAFQGMLGAYSHKACIEAFPNMEPLPCKTFDDTFKAVQTGKASCAMIPIDNSIAGRVADIHRLLPNATLKITSEHFIPIHHCLMAIPEAKLEDIKTVYSHVHALPQCSKFIEKQKIKPIVFEDTAGAAKEISGMKDKTMSAIASAAAAEIYGLKILKHNIEDTSDNVTRFVVLEKNAKIPKFKKEKDYITSIIFSTRNIPAALYKSLGGFATNGINISKLESYLEGKMFSSASFYCEIENHPEERLCSIALEELEFFSDKVIILGTYEKHHYRSKKS